MARSAVRTRLFVMDDSPFYVEEPDELAFPLMHVEELMDTEERLVLAGFYPEAEDEALDDEGADLEELDTEEFAPLTLSSSRAV